MRRTPLGLPLLAFLAGLLSACQQALPASLPAPAATGPAATDAALTPATPSATMPPMPGIMFREAALGLVDPIFQGQAPMIRMVSQITNRVSLVGFTPGSAIYNGHLSISEPVYWRWGLGYNKAAAPDFDMERLRAAFQYVQVAFFLNGYAIPPEGILVYDYDNPSAFGRDYIVILDNWPDGQHRLQLVVAVTQPVTVDGQTWQPGTMVIEDDIAVP